MAKRQAPSPLSISTIDSFQDILNSLRTYLVMDVAFVTEFLDGERFFHSVDSREPVKGISAGAILHDEVGYCSHVHNGRLPAIIPDTSLLSFAADLVETRQIPIGSHLSVPIVLANGSVFGSFCCFSFKPKPALGADALLLLTTFSRLIAGKIENELGHSRLFQAKTEHISEAIRVGDPTIFFQPIVRLGDMSLVGVEALSRFSSIPSRTPDLWFSDAAEVGLGVQLEMLACKKAIQAARDLPASVALNINFSPETLINGEVKQAVADFDPHRLVIEVTEHTPIADYDPLLVAVEGLRSTGVRIAIDDAGAGYSSMRHVLALRPDIIKLDVSLTKNLHLDPMKEAMAAALVAFSEKTGCKIVAEGVECQEELTKLRELQIHKGQGYFLGRPREADSFVASLN